jgi:predicted GIY-YIG superfamily endonuclease
MPKVWIYILENKYRNKSFYYVGQTERLFRRFQEHFENTGSMATNKFNYDNLVSLYCLGNSCQITQSERLQFENQITLQLMKLQDNPFRVRGGSWTCHGLNDKEWNPPLKKLLDTSMPVLCYCGMPAGKSKCGNFYRCCMDASKWIHPNSIKIYMNNKSCNFEINCEIAKLAEEPNYCQTCQIPCGQYNMCYNCKQIENEKKNIIENIEII